jgi:hypothetical protein
MLMILCHLIGDYCLQNQPMATEKTRSWCWAVIHGSFYMIPFFVVRWLNNLTGLDVFFEVSVTAALVMWSTHIVIDRLRLARYWIEFWGIGTFDSTVGTMIGYDLGPNAHEKDPDQDRRLEMGEFASLEGTHVEVLARTYAEPEPANDLYGLKSRHGVRYTATGRELTRLRRRQVPAWLSTWLLILVDNTMHLTINWICLTFLVSAYGF